MNLSGALFSFCSWLRRNSPAISLFILTAAVFSPACLNGFIEAYDDELYVTLNMTVRQGLTVGSTKWAFSTFVAGNWHPVTLLSHMTDVQLFGLNPFGHHLVSVLLHSVSVILLFHLLLGYGFESRVSWIASILFAIHPLRVESVVWIAERKDVLSLLFGLGALLAYQGYLRNGTLFRYLSVLALFILALMSKPMLVTLPFLMVLSDLFQVNGSSGPAGQRRFILLEKIPFLSLSLLTAWITLLAQKEGNALVSATFVERLGVALSAYAEYLRMFLYPVGLSFHYPLKPGMIGAGRILFSLLILVTISIYVHSRRGKSGERFGWWWFLLTLLPVTGIIRFGGQFVADRYTYLPQIGLIIMAASMLSAGACRTGGKKVLLAGGILLLLLSAMTIRETGYWKNGETLFRRAIALDPENWIAHTNLGSALIKNDRYGEGFLELARGQLYRGKPREALDTLRSVYREGGVSQEEIDSLDKEIKERIR